MSSDEMMKNSSLPQHITTAKTMRILHNVEDYRQTAKEKLPKMVYDFYQTGADDEVTLHENTAAYRRIKLRPSMFVDVSYHNTDRNSCAVSLLNGQITSNARRYDSLDPRLNAIESSSYFLLNSVLRTIAEQTRVYKTTV